MWSNDHEPCLKLHLVACQQPCCSSRHNSLTSDSLACVTCLSATSDVHAICTFNMRGCGEMQAFCSLFVLVLAHPRLLCLFIASCFRLTQHTCSSSAYHYCFISCNASSGVSSSKHGYSLYAMHRDTMIATRLEGLTKVAKMPGLLSFFSRFLPLAVGLYTCCTSMLALTSDCMGNRI